MARDKTKDDKYFNCSEKHENDYVSSLYGNNKDSVSNFLVTACDDNTKENGIELGKNFGMKNEEKLSICAKKVVSAILLTSKTLGDW